MSVLTHFPKNKFTELVNRFGGLNRDEAVANATKELETIRPEADKRIEEGVIELEKITAAAVAKTIDIPSAMKAMLPVADQIVTLAGTYGYKALDYSAKSLCDLIDGLIAKNKPDFPSVRVHIQTIRMFSPSSPKLPEMHINVLLAELYKVLDFHQIKRPVADIGSETATAAAKELKAV